MRRRAPSWALVAAIAAVVALATAGAANAAVSLTSVVSDPFSNPDSQHVTAVEPDTFSFGNRIVAAAQVGRYFNGGASGIGFATSSNGGGTWSSGVLPGLTKHNSPSGPFDRVSDPVVAYDARHDVWLISGIAIMETDGDIAVPRIVASRSTDGGKTWSDPVDVAVAGPGQDLDKNWMACDNHRSSPFYGNCYTTYDDFADGDRIYMTTSSDGGLTWSPPVQTAGQDTGLGGLPVVQPNGTVIVPAADEFELSIFAFRSTDGGQTWSRAEQVSPTLSHIVDGPMRTGPIPSADVDADGKVYVVWQSCRFRPRCTGNDIVLSTSTNGLRWSRPARVPIGTTSDGNDSFIPGIAAKPDTSSRNAKLGLTFYFYDDAACGSSCLLRVGYIQSNDGGQTWSDAVELAGAFPVAWVPDTSQGRMVGDYISTSWVGGKAFGAFAVATAAPTPFAQDIFVPTGGVNLAGPFENSSSDDRVATPKAELRAAERSALHRR